MNPRFPVFIVSKGRWQTDRRETCQTLDDLGVPYRVIVEPDEFQPYADALGGERVLPLPQAYHDGYDTCDPEGDDEARGHGPGPARNYAWERAIAEGHAWHWVMDDNIGGFFRFNRGIRLPVSDGTIFAVMEQFCLRYENVAMGGPNYSTFLYWRTQKPPMTLNTRVYSCNLIRCDLPYRWRGRYNEDTDLSLRCLKAGWCTIQFNAFLQNKRETQAVRGGNTDMFYITEGTIRKTRLLASMHPDCSRVVHRFGRIHHLVDYRRFRANRLRRKPDAVVSEAGDEFGMTLAPIAPDDPAMHWRKATGR